ncbi:AAA family ATPase, partial [Armatimonas sp.]|uniref:AAA family ATPase n=1 Tax=Armatimonas sp. TaxID=1872638 RepID=UPI00286B1786
MHLTRLSVQGFRSLKDITWEPGKLNVVIGSNGSGKSNILRVLDMLCDSTQGHLSNYVKGEGGGIAILWDGVQQDLKVDIHASSDFNDEFIDPFQDLSDYRYYLALSQNPFHQNSNNFYIKDEILSTNESVLIDYKIKTPELFEIYKNKISPFDLSETYLYSEKLSNSNYDVFILKNFIASVSLFMNFDISKNSPLRSPVLTEYEKKPSKNGENIINVLHTLYSENRDFKKIVNDSMMAAFGDDFDELVFPPASDQRVQMRIRWKSLKREQSAADLSDGTLRFLFLLAVLANPEPAPLIAI